MFSVDNTIIGEHLQILNLTTGGQGKGGREWGIVITI